MITYCALVYNRPELTARCIPQIIAAARLRPGDRFVVCDNASEVETRKVLGEIAEANSDVTVLLRNENIGVAAYQRVFRDYPNDFFVELDNDVTLPHDFGRRMAAVYQEVPGLCFVTVDIEWVPRVDADGTRHRMSLADHHEGHFVDVAETSVGRLGIIDGPSMRRHNMIAPGFCRMSPAWAWNTLEHPDLVYGTDAYMNELAVRRGYRNALLSLPELGQHHGTGDPKGYARSKRAEAHRSFEALKEHVGRLSEPPVAE